MIGASFGSVAGARGTPFRLGATCTFRTVPFVRAKETMVADRAGLLDVPYAPACQRCPPGIVPKGPNEDVLLVSMLARSHAYTTGGLD